MADFTYNPILIEKKGMNLEATLFCGQSFSWKKTEEGCFIGVAGEYAVRLYEQEEKLLIENINGLPETAQEEAFWKDYFALDIDYLALQEKFRKDKTLANCVDCSPGIRVLRQPFFETLLAFIISQNNHIPRITGIVERLKEEFGPKLAEGIYGCPAPETLAQLTPEDLAPLRAGFRARYLIDAAQKVAEGQVNEKRLRRLGEEEARKELCQIVGVGTKVADCVLLYSLGHNNVVPMDVWMKRAMQEYFPKGMPKVAKGYEGVAQQYIFCWVRANAQLAVPEKTKKIKKS